MSEPTLVGSGVGFEVRGELGLEVGFCVGREDGRDVLNACKSGGQFGALIPEMISVSNPTPTSVGLSDTLATGK